MTCRSLILTLCFVGLVGCGGNETDKSKYSTTDVTTITVPSGNGISPEGSLGAGEWRDADTVKIGVSERVQVLVLVKHDGANLCVRFTNVQSEKAEYFPILLIRPHPDSDSTWKLDDVMFEVNYQDCEAWGNPDSLTCGLLRQGWFANNFPTAAPGVIEIKLGAAHAGVDLNDGSPFGLALGVRGPDGNRAFWPPDASLLRPDRWGTATVHTK